MDRPLMERCISIPSRAKADFFSMFKLWMSIAHCRGITRYETIGNDAGINVKRLSIVA